MSASHTPTPWKASLARTLIHITNEWRGITSISVAPMKGHNAMERKEYRERALADAAFIVKAANCHDELVTALEELMEEAHKNMVGGAGHLIDNARNAISKARRGGT